MIVTGALIAASVALAGLFVFARTRPAKVPYNGGWRFGKVGSIFVAPSFPPEYRKALVDAANDWDDVRNVPENLGWSWIKATDSPYDAKGLPRPGIIVFDLRGQSFGEHLGETTKVMIDGEISAAVVRVPKGLDPLTAHRILRHEIGHALGYGHVDRSAHWMSGAKPGDERSGL